MNNIPGKVNFEKVLKVFREHYVEIPLEIYKDNPYEVLVSTLLSSRTRDEVTLEACKRLFKAAPDIANLRQLNPETIEELIKPVGFYKTKAKHLNNLAEILLLKHKGNVPNTREALMTLPGVGRKTANLVLQKAFNQPAIAVDTHVHKISNMLGWVKTNDPLKTEAELSKIIPQKYWMEINILFVSIGRQFYSNNKLHLFLKNEELL